MPTVPPSPTTTHKLKRGLGRVGRYAGPLNSTWSPDLIKAIQKHLNHAGLYSGAISGTYSIETAKGVQRFLRAISEHAGAIDGVLTEADWKVYLANVQKINQSLNGPAIPLPTFTNTVLPTISGIVKVANVLTASNGTWGTVTPDSYKYQWKKAGTVIPGATANTYTPVAGDIGATLTVTVTAVEEAYADAFATSAPTVAVIA